MSVSVSHQDGGLTIWLFGQKNLSQGSGRQISEFFSSYDPNRVIFSYNATDALNSIIFGLANPGCHVVSSRLEHNSVLRPLHFLREQGLIDLDMVPLILMALLIHRM